jgi:fluoroacetyl-CoA thioesterase
MLEKGIKGQGTVTVTKGNTAESMGSGSLAVLATPAMIALMEKTARLSVAPYLEEGQSTVGTLVNVKHLSASPEGMGITCRTELVDIDRRRLVFHVECLDGKGLIGEGTHERFIIDEAKFMAKANGKLER